jgi:hypothetical protein
MLLAPRDCLQRLLMVALWVPSCAATTATIAAERGMGGGDDEPPDATKDGIPAVLLWAAARVQEAEQDWASRHNGSVTAGRQASPADWSDQIVYQIMPDRFNNGNLSNDALNVPAAQRAADPANPAGLPDFRHGGDIAGITQRLDYIVDLGATALWITPLLMHDGSYHGYCTTDPTRIDPGFGTIDELHELIEAAHERGILVVLDVVVNHLCDTNTSYASAPTSHADCANALNTMYWAGTPGGTWQQGHLSFSPSFFPPLRAEEFFNRCGANAGGDTASQQPVAVFGDFTSSMFDLNTRDVDLMNIMTLMFQCAALRVCMYVHASERGRVRARVCACLRACALACVRACVR